MTRGSRTGDGRCGAALVTVVLVTLALFGLGHGLLTLALGELAASRAAVRHLEARAAAESVIHESFAAPGAGWMDSTASGAERSLGARSLGRAVGEARVRRLTTESWWVEGIGRVGVAESRAARLAWALDPLERVVSMPAAVNLPAGATLALDGSLDATTPTTAEPPMTPFDCEPWLAALEAHYGHNPLAAVAALPAGDTLPRLGLLGFDSLLAAASIVVAGSGTPAPSDSLGTCAASDPWNWGDPDRPWSLCGDHLPLRGARGTIEVVGGAGQGVLVVDGDVTLRDTRFYGLVIASGWLRLEDTAALEGMALLGRGLHVTSAARLRASACWAVRALAGQRATLGGFTRVPGAGLLGPL